MTEEFIRKLTKPLSEEELTSCLFLLIDKGFELYAMVETEDGQKQYVHGMEAAAFTDAVIYISAADRQPAIEVMKAQGLEELVCENGEVAHKLTPSQLAEQEFYRKKKINFIECMVIIVLVIIFYLVKSAQLFELAYYLIYDVKEKGSDKTPLNKGTCPV